MQLELSHLDLRYAGLRIIRPSKVSKLIQSINEKGQRSPVLVLESLESGSSKPILIDGYARVAALNALKRDLVIAQPVMETSQAALLSRLRQLSTGSSSAMEQGRSSKWEDLPTWCDAVLGSVGARQHRALRHTGQESWTQRD